jgi:glycerate kinase
MSIVPKPMTLEDCMDCAEELVYMAAARLCQLVSVGSNMSKKQ